VVVPDHIRSEVKHHLDTYVEDGPEAKLFAPANGGCQLNDQIFREQFNAALTVIGREGVRVHDPRHFAGTMTALTGATLASSAAIPRRSLEGARILPRHHPRQATSPPSGPGSEQP
jgi:hypothetical protein